MKNKHCNSADAKRVLFRSLAIVGAAAALLAGAAGCASVHRTSPGSFKGLEYKGANPAPLEQVYITSTGYFLLCSIPLASGDLRWNPEKKSINGGTCLFRDYVGAAELQDALLKIAESRNCDAIDIVIYDTNTSYAGVSTGGIIGALFGSSQIGISGVLVPKKQSAEAKKGGAK